MGDADVPWSGERPSPLDRAICLLGMGNPSGRGTLQISIQLTAETRDQLRAAGRVGETFDSIILRLIEAAKYVDFMEEQYSSLKSEKNWVRMSELP